MRKRNIIACIITFIILLLTNNFWLHSKPVDLKFDISGNGSVEIEAQLSNKFTKSSTVKKTVNIHELSHVKLKIDDIKTFSNLKIVVNSAFLESNRLKVENTRLQRGKYKPDIPKVKTENNSDGNIITYTYPVKGRASMSFEFEIFVIILVLGYLLSYKLIDYLADFKTIKEKSRLEILFLTLFFILLFIPMSHIDNVSTVSKTENRTLAKWSPLILKDNKINYNFGKDFDSWFSDRFLLRKAYIYMHHMLMYSLNKYLFVNDHVYIKSNNWILSSTPKMDNKNAFTPYVLSYLYDLDDFCKKNNIKLYIVDIPVRDHIYIDKYGYIKKNSSDFIPSEISSNLNIIYLYKEFKQVSNTNYVYFKTDHHWTSYGAYLVCNMLLKKIKQDFPQVKLLNKKDYMISESKNVKSEFGREYTEGVEIKYSFPFLKRFSTKILDTNYEYYTNKDVKNLKIKVFDEPYKLGKEFSYSKGSDLRVVLIGNSMNENLNDFLPYQFKYVKYYRLNSPRRIKSAEMWDIMKHYKQEIIANKPDILILCFNISYIEKNKIKHNK